MAYIPPNPNGATTGANSSPVVLASDQNNALETGGNLATIATNSATSANQTNGNQQTKLTNGTNIADVVAGDTGFNGMAIAGASKQYSFTISTSGAQMIGPYNCEGYSFVEVNFSSTGVGLALTGQFAPTIGGAYFNSSSWAQTSGTPNGALSTTANVTFRSGVMGNYFRLNVTALTSGTFSGTVTLRSVAPPFSATIATQGGTWTVGSYTGTGSAVPANAFYVGGRAATALPSATTIADLVGAYFDKFGRQVVIHEANRDLVNMQSTTITASTSSTTVVTALTGSQYADITSISLSNSSASATLATLSDGTNSYYFYVPAGDMRGAVYQVPLAATANDTAWTVTCGTSVSSLYVTIQYVENQ